jgi:hypothetical protein
VLLVVVEVELEELVAMTRRGCQWGWQPIAALPSPVAEATPVSTKAA